MLLEKIMEYGAINTSPPSSAGNIGNYGKLSALQQNLSTINWMQ